MAQDNIETTRGKILRITRELIASQGIHKTSLAMISRRAGISRGTLFYYYPSKQSLIYQIMEDNFREVTDMIVDTISRMDKGVKANRAGLFQFVLQSIGESRELNRINFYLFQEAVSRDKILQKRYQESYRQWQDLIAQQLNIHFPNSAAGHQPKTLARFILALIDGFSMQALLDYAPVDYRETASILTGLFMANGPAGEEKISSRS